MVQRCSKRLSDSFKMAAMISIYECLLWVQLKAKHCSFIAKGSTCGCAMAPAWVSFNIGLCVLWASCVCLCLLWTVAERAKAYYRFADYAVYHVVHTGKGSFGHLFALFIEVQCRLLKYLVVALEPLMVASLWASFCVVSHKWTRIRNTLLEFVSELKTYKFICLTINSQNIWPKVRPAAGLLL